MKRILALILILILTVGLFGCAKVSEESAPESVIESNVPEPEKEPATVAICMGSINHPVHRIVQTGFMLKAEELGMNGIISGLDEGSMIDLIAKWDKDVQNNNVSGILLWTGDDSCYELMKEWKTEGRYTVAPHFVHDYKTTKDFLDKNMSCLALNYGRNVADYIVNVLIEKGITSGSIGVTTNGGCCIGSPAIDGFIERMDELDTPFTLIDTRMESAEPIEASRKITKIIHENPDIVAGFGSTGGSPKSWSEAMEATGYTDLVVVGLDYTELNMELVENGKVTAIVCQPLFEEGGACAQALYDLHNGAVFNTSEDTWFEELEAPIADIDDMPHYRGILQKMYDYFGIK